MRNKIKQESKKLKFYSSSIGMNNWDESHALIGFRVFTTEFGKYFW